MNSRSQNVEVTDAGGLVRRRFMMEAGLTQMEIEKKMGLDKSTSIKTLTNHAALATRP